MLLPFSTIQAILIGSNPTMLSGLDAMRRAFSYLRFSSAKQMKGDSRRRQTEFAESICKKHGWVLDDSLNLQDLGVSAYRSKNVRVGALAEFLEAVQSGRVSRGSILIVENIDRLSRNKVGVALQLFIQLLNHGITIVTADPERIYTEESINDVAALLEPIIYMSRAHEESRVKSMRLRKVWNRKKDLAASEGRPLGTATPHWIELTPDGFRLIPERAATIREIFRMSSEGMGAKRIVKALVDDPVTYPPFGRSGKWNVIYVNRLLRYRSTFGEYQRFTADPESGVRRPQGEPILGYYPAAITEEEYYRAQAAISGRGRPRGRPAEGELNLFTGIVHDAVGKTTMHLRSSLAYGKRKASLGKRYTYLVSLDWLRDARRASPDERFGRFFDYPAFERAVLAAVSELTPADLQDKGQSADAQAEAIRSETDALIALDHKLSTLKAKAADPKTKPAALPAVLELIESTAQAKQDTAKRLEKLKADALSGRPETLGETQSLVKLLADAKGKEVETLRRRLKSRLRLIIDEIWVVIQRLDGRLRAAHIQLCYRGGATKYILTFSPKPPVPSVADALSGKYTLLPLWNVDFCTLDPNSPRGPLAGYVKIDDDVIKALERLTWKPGSR
jgi:DNA invertase Pin-like site-specific DNA recombinase